MDKAQAIQIITNACNAYRGTKQEHVAIEKALEMLLKELGEKVDEQQ